MQRLSGLGRCGLCGHHRHMTEAHVPPQGIGNRAPLHRRASWVTSPRGAGIDSYKPGGLSVFGLCFNCKNVSSGAADPAYIDFHNAVTRYWSPTIRRLLVEPTAVPAPVAPGLVARSVLVGLFAINDRLQDHSPDLARGLRDDDPNLRLPDELRLRIALMEGARSRIGGPVGYMRVLTRRETCMPFADVCSRRSRGASSRHAPVTQSWPGRHAGVGRRNCLGAVQPRHPRRLARARRCAPRRAATDVRHRRLGGAAVRQRDGLARRTTRRLRRKNR